MRKPSLNNDKMQFSGVANLVMVFSVFLCSRWQMFNHGWFQGIKRAIKRWPCFLIQMMMLICVLLLLSMP